MCIFFYSEFQTYKNHSLISKSHDWNRSNITTTDIIQDNDIAFLHPSRNQQLLCNYYFSNNLVLHSTHGFYFLSIKSPHIQNHNLCWIGKCVETLSNILARIACVVWQHNKRCNKKNMKDFGIWFFGVVLSSCIGWTIVLYMFLVRFKHHRF